MEDVLKVDPALEINETRWALCRSGKPEDMQGSRKNQN